MTAVLLFVALAIGPNVILRAVPPSAQMDAAPQVPSQDPGSAHQQPTDAYSYQPDGRRDPFVSVLGGGNEPRTPLKPSDGPGGLTVSEVSVRGVVTSKGALLAMIQAPDKKTYVVHAGDKLMDGLIKSITFEGLVIVQDVNDPLSLVKQREVRKPLRSAEDPK